MMGIIYGYLSGIVELTGLAGLGTDFGIGVGRAKSCWNLVYRLSIFWVDFCIKI